MGKKFSFAAYDRKHLKNLLRRATDIRKLLDDAAREGARIGQASGFTNPDGEFTFDKFPAIKQRIEELFKGLHDQLLTVVTDGNREEWLLSAAKNDAMVDSRYSRAVKRFGARAEAWHEPHLEALEAFNARKERGMNLSDRVWKLTDQFKGELELALEMGLGEGKSAAALSRDVREFLKEPHRLFRRVRNEKGQLRLSKAAAAYHPGQGVYRSSYKNALRLTATENNMAYRTADHERWNDLDFVIGMEIRLSGNHPVEDICDEMCGVYPKTFKFVGWHPFCRCYAVPKLADEDEFIKRQQALIDGEDVPQGGYAGEVTEMPECFNDWVRENAERIETAKSEPYFIRDNRTAINQILRSETPRHLVAGDTGENMGAVADALGINAGAPMTFDEANEMRGNPNYRKAAQYRSNCQSAVLANEMRRRGFDVEAYGNSKKEWYMPSILAKKPEIAFIGADGTPPIPKGVQFDGNLLTSLSNEMNTIGRYHLRFRFENNCGHIITAERLADGTLRIYDPQSGKLIKDFSEFASKVNSKSFEYYRVDNLEINPDVARGVVKARGAKGDAPRMQLPEIQSALEKGWYGGDIKANVAEFVKARNAANTYREKIALDMDIVRNGGFIRSEYHSTSKGSIFATDELPIKISKENLELTKNIQMAKKMANNGYDCYLLSNPQATKSADFIFVKNGKVYYTEGKLSTGKNSLDHNLSKGGSQSERILIDLTGTKDTNYIVAQLENTFANNDNLKEVMLLKGSRLISISSRQAERNNFNTFFRKLWETKK